MSSSCAMGATTSGGSPSCASSLAVRRYMCPLGVMYVRYMCPFFIYMELSVYMELSRLSGRLYGDSGRLCGTTLRGVGPVYFRVRQYARVLLHAWRALGSRERLAWFTTCCALGSVHLDLARGHRRRLHAPSSARRSHCSGKKDDRREQSRVLTQADSAQLTVAQ